MKTSTWQIQEAKNRFSEVVELARTKGAQTITKHGKPVVVVVEIGEFRNLEPAKRTKKKRSLIEHLRACPEPGFIESVLKMRDKKDFGRTIDLS